MLVFILLLPFQFLLATIQFPTTNWLIPCVVHHLKGIALLSRAFALARFIAQSQPAFF